jgi:hypothetical protein
MGQLPPYNHNKMSIRTDMLVLVLVREKGCAIDTWYDGRHVSIIAVSSFYYCLNY